VSEAKMNVDFPFRFDRRGWTGDVDDEGHIRDLIEQVLFTAPGERVNRPDFGSGLLQMVFAPNSQELAAALQFTTQAALQQYLGAVIDVQSLEVTAEDANLTVHLKYLLRAAGEVRDLTLNRSTTP
jgi:phage baseplate assembly protein W